MTKTTYQGIDYGLGRSNIDSQTGMRFGVISQHSIAPESFEDIFNDSRDLTHESAIEEAKRRIGSIECQEDLADVLDDLIGKREGYRLVCYEEVEAILIESPLPLSKEAADSIWDAIEQAWSDRYDDCGERDWLYEKDGYKLSNCLQSDVFVLASPYFTYAQYCSPCVPGACNLDSPLHTDTDASEVHCICKDHGIPKAFCLGHDWFENNKAPYPVYSVETGEKIMA